MVKIDWDKIAESNALILKENETVQIKFLNNGSQGTTEIIDSKTNEPKTIDKYEFDIIDLSNNTAKELSIIQRRLMFLLKEFKPLKDKSFNVNKFRTGTGQFDVDFRISEITIP